MEFRKPIKGLRLELGIEGNGHEARVFGNENGMRIRVLVQGYTECNT